MRDAQGFEDCDILATRPIIALAMIIGIFGQQECDKFMKPLISLLTFVFLLQSCTVYHTTSIPIEQAMELSGPFKVENLNEGNTYYLKIWKRDSMYYGDPVGGAHDTVKIERDAITAIYPVDTDKSNKSVILPLAGLVAMSIIVFLNSFDWY